MEAMNREEVIINDGTMHQYCINHPHRKNPAGICAFCLQEKLGKLVSSTSSSFPSSSSSSSSSSSYASPPSSSPSFRFNTLQTSSSSSSSLNSLSLPPTSSSTTTKRHHHIRSRIPFLLPNKKKPPSCSSSANVTSSDSVFKRSKSTTTPRRTKFLDNDDAENGDFAFRKRNSFWSFLYLSSRPSNSCNKKMEVKSFKESNSSPSVSTAKPKFCSSTLGRNCEMVVEEENEEEEEEEEVSGSSSGSMEQRKVSRSRSVGCGSRSFSGDLFEKISTGFGDCSLRRVESQREGKANKVISSSGCMKERVKCGGIFGGFMMMSSSSSYWVSSGDDGENSHGRSRSSWSWALASPMRAFSNKTTSKRDANSQNNNSPNLSAVPSLLTVKG